MGFQVQENLPFDYDDASIEEDEDFYNYLTPRTANKESNRQVAAQ